MMQYKEREKWEPETDSQWTVICRWLYSCTVQQAL